MSIYQYQCNNTLIHISRTYGILTCLTKFKQEEVVYQIKQEQVIVIVFNIQLASRISSTLYFLALVSVCFECVYILVQIMCVCVSLLCSLLSFLGNDRVRPIGGFPDLVQPIRDLEYRESLAVVRMKWISVQLGFVFSS